METLLRFIEVEILCLLAGLMVAIIWSLLFRKYEDSETTPQASGPWLYNPINMQLALITILVGIYLVLQVAEHPTEFPEIPPYLLALLGLSGATQVGVNYYELRRLKDRPRI